MRTQNEVSKPIRVSESSHRATARIAGQLNLSMIEVYDRAIAALERELFFARMNEAYQILESAEKLHAFKDEIAAWDATLADGLE